MLQMNAKKLIETNAWRILKETQKPEICYINSSLYKTLDLKNYILEECGLYLDISKQFINKEIISNLISLAKELNLKSEIEDLFTGKIVNFTEFRAALHSELRKNNSEINPLLLQEIEVSKFNLSNFCSAIHNSHKKSISGRPFKYVVNIGIGGSDLGPRMVCEALKDYKNLLDVHFISNIDIADLNRVLGQVFLDQTLFIISSKTFATTETITNANTIKQIMIDKFGIESINTNFIAVSTNVEACVKFGIAEENIFKFWDWVGGRFSLWSAIGLSIALQIGWNGFEELLSGANEMDKHFRATPLERNLPVILALLGVWNRNFMDFRATALIPYSRALARLPDYMQQLEMESNGKSINKFGEKVNYKTSGVLFGVSGTDAQHSFFQMLHQGSDIIPVDFVGIRSHSESLHSNILNANLIAQAEALLIGKNIEKVKEENIGIPDEIIPHKVFEGNRPSTILLLQKLDPRNLGKLIALYEHKTYVQGVIWQINSFDQWGVELGKQLAKSILTDFENESIANHDESTLSAINKIKKPLD